MATSGLRVHVYMDAPGVNLYDTLMETSYVHPGNILDTEDFYPGWVDTYVDEYMNEHRYNDTNLTGEERRAQLKDEFRQVPVSRGTIFSSDLCIAVLDRNMIAAVSNLFPDKAIRFSVIWNGSRDRILDSGYVKNGKRTTTEDKAYGSYFYFSKNSLRQAQSGAYYVGIPVILEGKTDSEFVRLEVNPSDIVEASSLGLDEKSAEFYEKKLAVLFGEQSPADLTLKAHDGSLITMSLSELWKANDKALRAYARKMDTVDITFQSDDVHPFVKDDKQLYAVDIPVPDDISENGKMKIYFGWYDLEQVDSGEYKFHTEKDYEKTVRVVRNRETLTLRMKMSEIRDRYNAYLDREAEAEEEREDLENF